MDLDSLSMQELQGLAVASIKEERSSQPDYDLPTLRAQMADVVYGVIHGTYTPREASEKIKAINKEYIKVEVRTKGHTPLADRDDHLRNQAVAYIGTAGIVESLGFWGEVQPALAREEQLAAQGFGRASSLVTLLNNRPEILYLTE